MSVAVAPGAGAWRVCACDAELTVRSDAIEGGAAAWEAGVMEVKNDCDGPREDAATVDLMITSGTVSSAI